MVGTGAIGIRRVSAGGCSAARLITNAAEVASTTCLPARRPGGAESPRGLGRSQRPECRCPPCARSGWRARRPGPWKPRLLVRQRRQPKTQHRRGRGPRPGLNPRLNGPVAGRILACQRPRRQVPCMTPARMRRHRDLCRCGTGPRPTMAPGPWQGQGRLGSKLLFPWVSARGPCQSQVPRLSRANLKVGQILR